MPGKSALHSCEVGCVERGGRYRIPTTSLARLLERRSYKPYGGGSAPVVRIFAFRTRYVWAQDGSCGVIRNNAEIP